MTSYPIPNDDERCPCMLGKAEDENAIIMHGPESLAISVYPHCPLHGEMVQNIVRSGLKGLSLGP